MKRVTKIIKYFSFAVFTVTMIPSLIWPNQVPMEVHYIAFVALVIAGGISVSEQSKMWNGVSEKWRKMLRDAEKK